MSKTPILYYFDVNSRKMYDSNGNPVANNRTKPSIVLSEKSLINIQLVSDSDLTPYTELITGTTAEMIVDNDFSNPVLQRELSVSDAWTPSVSGIGEYYYTNDIAGTPATLFYGETQLTSGIIGSLTSGEFAYGDNDGIGSDSIYVRLPSDIDPDTSTSGIYYKLEQGTYTKNFIYSSQFNTSGTWYNASTDTYTDPNIAAGQITFNLNANTEAYYDRILADSQALSRGIATGTVAQINYYAPGSADIFLQHRFEFLCRHRFIPDTGIRLELQEINVYSKTQVDSLLNGYIPKVSPAVAGNTVILNADGTLSDAGVVPGSGGSGTSGYTLKVNADDASDDFLSGKVDLSQFEVVSDSYVRIKDDGLNISNINGLSAELSGVTVDTSDLQPKNLSGQTLKASVTGSEYVGIDDAGTYKATTLQAVSDFAVSNFPDVEVENGINTPSSEITNADDGIHITAQRDTSGAVVNEVVFLGHMDGSEGDAIIVDSSNFAHTVSYFGDPLITYTNELTKFGSNLYLSGEGFDIPDTNFDPQASEFAFACKFYVDSADVNNTFVLVDIETASNKVLKVFMENGFLKYKIGVNGSGSSWTNEDSVEVTSAGYLNASGWNTIIFQRNSNELQLGLNGNVLARLSMTSKTLNTPSAGKIHFGKNYLDGESFIGHLDDVILTDGINLIDITTNQPTPTTYTDWTTEWYVTKKYDIDPRDSDGSYRQIFTNSDISLSGSDYYLDINHNLNETLVDHVIINPNLEVIDPDLIQMVDTDNSRVWLTSFYPISGNWRVFVDVGGNGVGTSTFDFQTVSNWDLNKDQYLGHLSGSTESWVETLNIEDLPNISTLIEGTTSGTYNLDLDSTGVYDITLNGDTSFSVISEEAGKAKMVNALITASTDLSASFDPTWNWLGSRPTGDVLYMLSGSVIDLAVRSSGAKIIAGYQELV